MSAPVEAGAVTPKEDVPPGPVIERLYAAHVGHSDDDDAPGAAVTGGDEYADPDAAYEAQQRRTEAVYDKALFVLVRCSDDVAMLVPRQHVAELPFLPPEAATADDCAFAYPSLTLVHLYAWVRHYGMHGVAASPLRRPCTYLDFLYVAVDPWDNLYYSDCVTGDGFSYVTTLRAAEEYGMQGLHDFLCVALGCELRGAASASKIAMLLGLGFADEPISESELAQVDVDYPWIAPLTQPQSAS